MNDHNENLVGNLIKQRRLLVPLTLQELAANSGVSSSHLGRIERVAADISQNASLRVEIGNPNFSRYVAKNDLHKLRCHSTAVDT